MFINVKDINNEALMYRYCTKCLMAHADGNSFHDSMKTVAINAAKREFIYWGHGGKVFRSSNPQFRSAEEPRTITRWDRCNHDSFYLITAVDNRNDKGEIIDYIDRYYNHACPHVVGWQYNNANRQNFFRGFDMEISINLNFAVWPNYGRIYRKMPTKQPLFYDYKNEEHLAILAEARDYLNKTR